MPELTQSRLSELLDTGIVVRGELFLANARRRQMRIDILSRAPSKHRQGKWITYEGPLPRLAHPRGLVGGYRRKKAPKVNVRLVTPDGDHDWGVFQEEWPSEWFADVRNVFTVTRQVRPGVWQSHRTPETDPRFMAELTFVQMLVDQAIESQRGSQADLVRAYNMLGHLIEAQHRSWDSVFP